jgi:flagellum-specific peptidoglycan hydrolase FlgJ
VNGTLEPSFAQRHIRNQTISEFIGNLFNIKPPTLDDAKVSVKTLTKTGVWKHIPDLVRNDLWIKGKPPPL